MKMNLSEHIFGCTFLGGIQYEAEMYNPDENDICKIQIWDPAKHPLAWTYLYNSGTIFFNICDTFEELNISSSLIEKCSKEALVKNFTNASLLTYFLKNWISRYITLYEISLLLVNEVMEFGISKDIGTRTKIEARLKKPENSPIQIIIQNMKDLVGVIIYKCGNKQIWNLNIDIKHSGKFYHDNISDIGWVEFQEKWGISENEVSSKITLTESIVDEIDVLSEKMYIAIDKLLSKLDIIYENRFNELKSKTGQNL